MPLALAVGTVPRMLARVDRLLTHTVSLAGLTALIVVAYLLALAAFGRKPTGSERSLLLLSMLAAAGAALAYQPARAWLTERANRVVYGERVSPDEALRTWGIAADPRDPARRAAAAAGRDACASRCSSAAPRSGPAPTATTRSRRWCRTARSAPYFVGEKERVVVSRAGVSGGTWLDIWLPGFVAGGMTAIDPRGARSPTPASCSASSRASGPPTARRSPRTTTGCSPSWRGRSASPCTTCSSTPRCRRRSTSCATTNEELRASRVRIVAAGDAERRKLERNLHDGAQQHLVALAVKLRLAKDAVVDDPADAEAMIDEVRGDLQNAITELRALAHGIFPPLLISGGLAEALPAAAARAALPTIDRDRGRAPRPRGRGGDLLLLHGGAAERRQARRRRRPARWCKVWEDDEALHWQVADDGAGLRSGRRRRCRPRLRQHARPHGRLRRHDRGRQRRRRRAPPSAATSRCD